MGSRGPQPGFKLARAQKAALASTSQAPKAAAPQPAAASPIPDAKPTTAPVKKARAAAPEPSAADRENPDKLTGDALRALAHRRGLAKSMLPAMSDEKIRTELRYLAHRQYSDEPA